MAKLFENQSPDEYLCLGVLFANLEPFSLFLNFEIYEDKVYIFTIPGKGHPDEEKSLTAMEIALSLIGEQNFLFDPLFRNTPSGDRVDGVRIWLLQLPV